MRCRDMPKEPRNVMIIVCNKCHEAGGQMVKVPNEEKWLHKQCRPGWELRKANREQQYAKKLIEEAEKNEKLQSGSPNS